MTLWLTFNPVLVLTGFRKTRPRALPPPPTVDLPYPPPTVDLPYPPPTVDLPYPLRQTATTTTTAKKRKQNETEKNVSQKKIHS